jgi:hydrogenase-4 component B
VSGVPACLLDIRSARGQWIATAALVLAALLGLGGCGVVLLGGSAAHAAFAWAIPGGEIVLQVDALGAFFLVPVCAMGALASIYGHGYWRQSERPRHGRMLRFFTGILVAGMMLLLLAGDAVSFLVGWEAMALGSFFLIRIEDHLPAARDAGWLYLLATHVGTLALFALFAVLRDVNGSFALVAVPAGTPLVTCTAVFLLALLAFGLKAGLMPLHVWLPSAHASSPSHISALMSGVVIKMGIYGLVRTCALLPDPPVGWGGLLLVLGAASGILGVAFAIAQHDIKRLLAYHSIENIGIITIGLGLAMVGRSVGRADWVVLGLAGCLLHVWNHGFFKALLFLGAGSVIHAAGTRRIDRMGGLARRMPQTALLFLIGAVAICGLPPLNGFVSEFLIYLGLFRTLGPGTSWSQAALAVPVLALIGALALACFVKVFGAVFLGTARGPRAADAHESPASMIVPMAALALACAAIGIAPLIVAPILERTVAAWMPGVARQDGLSPLVPFGWIGAAAAALVLLVAAGSIWARSQSSRGRLFETWACGYVRPSPRIQYTSSSFGQMLVGLFAWILRPHTRHPRIAGSFPHTSRFESHVEDAVLERALVPGWRSVVRRLGWVRLMQQGRVQQYLLYILVAVVVLLLWSVPSFESVTHLFDR